MGREGVNSAPCCYYKHDLVVKRINMNYQYKNQEVRDLAWSCFAPPLIRVQQAAPDSNVRDCTPELSAQRRQWLEHLDRDPSALLEYLATRSSRRLGIYFESLWQFFLREDPDFELVAHNLPVHDGTRTLGEFDCIYFCKTRERFIHLELAAKFFLYCPPAAGVDPDREWPGRKP